MRLSEQGATKQTVNQAAKTFTQIGGVHMPELRTTANKSPILGSCQ
jgi:hypothetical protein